MPWKCMEVPIRVEYEITEKAKELGPILAQLAQWGAKASSQGRYSEP